MPEERSNINKVYRFRRLRNIYLLSLSSFAPINPNQTPPRLHSYKQLWGFVLCDPLFVLDFDHIAVLLEKIVRPTCTMKNTLSTVSPNHSQTYDFTSYNLPSKVIQETTIMYVYVRHLGMHKRWQLSNGKCIGGWKSKTYNTVWCFVISCLGILLTPLYHTVLYL